MFWLIPEILLSLLFLLKPHILVHFSSLRFYQWFPYTAFFEGVGGEMDRKYWFLVWVTFNFRMLIGMANFACIIVYMSAVSKEVGNKQYPATEMDDPLFHYSYGYSFIMLKVKSLQKADWLERVMQYLWLLGKNGQIGIFSYRVLCWFCRISGIFSGHRDCCTILSSCLYGETWRTNV